MIYDRTILDVTDAKKIIAKFQSLGDWSSITASEINTLERGTYTKVSLNRVETMVQIICDTFRNAGYSVEDLIIKYDWDDSGYFNKSEHKRFFSNIHYLMSIIPLLSDTPEAPYFNSGGYTYGNISHAIANDAEKILFDLKTVLDYITSTTHYKSSNGRDVVSGSSSQLWRAGKISNKVGYFITENLNIFCTSNGDYFIVAEEN